MTSFFWNNHTPIDDYDLLERDKYKLTEKIKLMEKTITAVMEAKQKLVGFSDTHFVCLELNSELIEVMFGVSQESEYIRSMKISKSFHAISKCILLCKTQKIISVFHPDVVT